MTRPGPPAATFHVNGKDRAWVDGKPRPAFNSYYPAKKADPSWRLFEVPCGHDVMVDVPEELAGILSQVA